METIGAGQGNDERFHCRRVRPGRPLPDLAEDARRGLLATPRALPPKYFYDARGSRLFDRICATPEYYPTRTEAALLAWHAPEIVAATRPAHIIELGSGTARKTRHLFDACQAQGRACVYWPFDVCETTLHQTGRALTGEYDWLWVRALAGDYLAGLDDLPAADGVRLFVFLGGTIGNFTAAEATEFLAGVRRCMRPDDRLLLGADRVKDHTVLHRAYNDAAGITAAFNLNLLRVLNRELRADFDLGGFAHEALYNPEAAQIEMYLVAKRAQRIRLSALGQAIRFVAGERVLTEISRKFTTESLGALCGAAGLAIERHYQPGNGYFSLVLTRP